MEWTLDAVRITGGNTPIDAIGARFEEDGVSCAPPEPPALSFAPALSRRQALQGGILAAGLVAAPLSAQLGGGFTHGVASGEPSAQSVLLWTRYVGSAPTTLRFEVSETVDFARTLSGGEAAASPDHDWCAKAAATGLAPAQWYYYRFLAPDGTASAVGRTRTLPDGETDRFRMAVFSCSNMGFGYFNGYAHANAADAFELAVHLGDYFYEYDHDHYPTERQRVAGRLEEPLGETIHLADYRLRYASYRRDPDLLRLHQLYPMIAIFDDHETANDAWKGGAENHQPGTEGDWPSRVRAAMQARREWLPVSDADWASYDIGDLATIFRLETRITARDKQFDLGAITRAVPAEQVEAALTAFGNGAYRDPKRTLMGAEQEKWLDRALAASVRSGRKWQVLAQQIVMGSLRLPSTLDLKLDPEVEKLVSGRMAALNAASEAGVPFNMDAWDGYPAARERLLGSAREAEANLVVLSGDSHNAWACELPAAGVEFAGHSITSPGAEGYFQFLKPADLERALVATNPQLKWTNSSQRGYMAVELTPARATCEWRFTDSVRNRSSALAGTHRMSADFGARRFTG